MERSLKNKIVVITGGAEGIGLEIANNFIKNGAKLAILLDINEDKGNKAVEDLSEKFGLKKAVFIKCNVVFDLDETFEKICERFGKVDVLVNSAGVIDELVPEKCIDVNLTATMKWSIKFQKHMKIGSNSNGGTIINISSIMGYRITHFCPVYHATKFGVIGFTKSLGHEKNYNDNGVRVIAICPGFTKTGMTKNIHDGGNELHMHIKINFIWQSLEELGEKAVEVFEVADSGTVWEIEGGNLKEIL